MEVQDIASITVTASGGLVEQLIYKTMSVRYIYEANSDLEHIFFYFNFAQPASGDLTTVAVDEADVVAQASVNTGESTLSASLTPRNNTNQGSAGVNDGATRVSRAGVLATGGNSSAEHVVADLAIVVAVASGAGNDGDGNLPQGGGERVGVLRSSSPISQLASVFLRKRQ